MYVFCITRSDARLFRDISVVCEHCVFVSSNTNPSESAVVTIMLKTSDATMVIGDFHPADAVSVRCLKIKAVV